MNNNDVVPGFDEEIPRLDPSWGNVRWKPIGTKLIPVPDLPDCLIVKLTGELEAFSASYLGQRMDLVVSKGYKNILFDLSDVILGDYREVLFLSTHKATLERGGTTVICGARANLTQYLQLIGIHSFLNFEDTVEAATLKIRSKR
jgi:anti-anti-sigma regulatory factor